MASFNYRNTGMSACYGCTDRHEGCHSNCDRYISEKKNHDESKRKEDIQRDAEMYLDCVLSRSRRRK